MSDEHEPRWHGTGYGGGAMVCRCGDQCEDGYNAHAEGVHDAQIRDLLEEREDLLTEIRRLRMGNHPAGRALREDGPPPLSPFAKIGDLRPLQAVPERCTHDYAPCPFCDPPDPLREALTERDAGQDRGEGA